MIEGTTPELLRLYFGFGQGRSIKKKDLHDELVRRGVSIIAVNDTIDQMLFTIGWAADNRIPEIDYHLEGGE